MSKDFYGDDLKVKDALEIYFSRYHFPNGGYDLKWFRIKLGPVYIPLPNTKARIEAVKLHDIHHLLTEYEANLKGEAEIGAWEIASGCGRYYMAWILNAGSFLYGIFFFTRSIFNSFVKGRSVRDNLYYETVYNDELLVQTIGELRDRVGVRLDRNKSLNDYLFFVLYCVIIIASELAIGYLLYVLILKIISFF